MVACTVAKLVAPGGRGQPHHPDGKGYWLVASDGGIFTYPTTGGPTFYGSIVLNAPIVGISG